MFTLIVYLIGAVISMPIMYNFWVGFVAKDRKSRAISTSDTVFVLIETLLTALIWPLSIGFLSLRLLFGADYAKEKVQKSVDKANARREAKK